MYEWHDGAWGPGAWFALSMMLVFLIVAVGLVVYVVRSSGTRTTAQGPETSSARRILDERFARGEIDADEYKRRGDLLRSP